MTETEGGKRVLFVRYTVWARMGRNGGCVAEDRKREEIGARR